MAFKRFQTDWRLWFWISLVLFVTPWFLPLVNMKGSHVPPIIWWGILFTDPSHFEESLIIIAMFILLVGIVAIYVGWVLLCLLVMSRSRKLDIQAQLKIDPDSN